MDYSSATSIRKLSESTVNLILNHMIDNEVVSQNEFYMELRDELTDIIMSAITLSHWKDH